MGFMLETFSFLHYLLESFGVGVLATAVGHGDARTRKQLLPNSQQDTSCKEGAVPLQRCCVLAIAIGLCCFTGVKYNIPKRHKLIHDPKKGFSPDLCKFQIPALARLTLGLTKKISKFCSEKQRPPYCF